MEYQSAEQRRKFTSKFSEVVLQSSTAVLGLAFPRTANEPANTGRTSCSGYSPPVASSKQGSYQRNLENVSQTHTHIILIFQHFSTLLQLSLRISPIQFHTIFRYTTGNEETDLLSSNDLSNDFIRIIKSTIRRFGLGS